MNKRLGGAVLAAGVLVLGTAVGYWHFAEVLPGHDLASETRPSADRSPGRAPTPEPAAAPAEVPVGREERLAAASPQAETPPPADTLGDASATSDGSPPDAAADAARPVFELLRVEPDGSAVIAGRAAPGAEIVLRDGDAVLARERANSGGEFAIVLDAPLAPGSHALQLETAGEGGASILSAETAIVDVPEPGREDELLVALEAPDRPTEFLAVPSASAEAEPEQAATPPAAPTSPPAGTELAAASPAAPPSGPPPVVAPGETGPDAAAVDPQNASPGGQTAGLGIAAVEIEDDQLFIAGTARPGARVRLYLDDDLVAETATGAGDRFIAEALRDVPVGSHVVRADEIGVDGTVVSRAEVPFERPEGANVAARAPEPGAATPQPAPVVAAAASPDGPPDAPGTTPSAPASSDLPASPADEPAADSDAVPSVATADLRLQPALEPVEGRVLIRRGDTLWRISRDTYGRGSRYTVIYLANGAQIRDPDLIYPGQVFRLPGEGEGGPAGEVGRAG